MPPWPWHIWFAPLHLRPRTVRVMRWLATRVWTEVGGGTLNTLTPIGCLAGGSGGACWHMHESLAHHATFRCCMGLSQQSKCAHDSFTPLGNCSAGSGVGPRASKNIFARTACRALLPDPYHSRQVQPIATEHCSGRQQCWKLQQRIGRVQASLLTAVSCSAAVVVAHRAAACSGGQHAGVPAHQPALG